MTLKNGLKSSTAKTYSEDGMIDKELCNRVLKNYGHKLQAKQRALKLIELREKYDEFNKSIMSTCTDVLSLV